MEQWKVVREFPDYSISDYARVKNNDTGRIMTVLRNQYGLLHVGLTKGGKQYKRSLTLLVATYWLEDPNNNKFDTPVHLDGNKENLSLDNLVWRPRWFACKYALQFAKEPRGYRVPVENLTTGEIFPTSWDAAVRYGLLDIEILVSAENKTYVWPTYHRYQIAKQI